VYPLALEKTGRRFVIPIIRTRSFGRYPARLVSRVRNRTFRYARRGRYFIKTHLWYFRIPSRPPLRCYLDYSQPVAGFYVCTLDYAEARTDSSRSVHSPQKAYIGSQVKLWRYSFVLVTIYYLHNIFLLIFVTFIIFCCRIKRKFTMRGR